MKEQWKKWIHDVLGDHDVLGVHTCIVLAFSDDCEVYGRSISECLLRVFLALNMVTPVLTYKKVLSITSWQMIS